MVKFLLAHPLKGSCEASRFLSPFTKLAAEYSSANSLCGSAGEQAMKSALFNRVSTDLAGRSGILLFITGFAAIFVFIILYMIIAQLRRSGISPGEDSSINEGWSPGKDTVKKKRKASFVLSIVLPILFSGYLGYQTYVSTSSYFVEADAGANISIASLDRISESLFSEYLLVVLILLASLLAATIWFTIMLDFRKDRQKESKR